MFQPGIDDVITPNAAKVLRKQMREAFSYARAHLDAARKLRADSRDYYRTELADDEILVMHNGHDDARAIIRRLRSSTVRKYANLSPRAAASETARRNK